MARAKRKQRAGDVTKRPEKPVNIVASGFGELLGEIAVGAVIGINSRVIQVKFKDEDGEFIEKYQASTGVRIEDIGCKSGWRINLNDLASDKPFKPIDIEDEEQSARHEFKMLHKEEFPYSSSDSMVVEVWEDLTAKQLYFKAYRTGFVGEGDKKRPRQLPCVVPFNTLKQVLFDFDIDWAPPAQTQPKATRKTRK